MIPVVIDSWSLYSVDRRFFNTGLEFQGTVRRSLVNIPQMYFSMERSS